MARMKLSITNDSSFMARPLDSQGNPEAAAISVVTASDSARIEQMYDAERELCGALFTDLIKERARSAALVWAVWVMLALWAALAAWSMRERLNERVELITSTPAMEVRS